MGIDFFGGGQDRRLRRVDSDGIGDVDGVLDDPSLGVQIRCDIQGTVTDEKVFRIGRRLHHENMAHPAVRAQAGIAGHNGRHQFVRVQAAFHQRLHLADPGEIDAGLGGGVAVRCVDDLGTGQIEAELICDRANALLRTDQDRLDQPGRLCVQGGLKRVLADGMNDRGRHGGAACT